MGGAPIIRDDLVAAIHAARESTEAQGHRAHLGASVIGAECERAVWYSFRHAVTKRFDGRMLRLFETGQIEEPRMVADLQRIGADVYDEDPSTGKQWRVSAFGGHFGGSLDGICANVPGVTDPFVLAEFKTHSAKSFADLSAKGVRASKPQHYAQMQVYMHLHKTPMLASAVYVAKDKNTDHLHAEVIRYDQRFAASMMERAERVIFGMDAPARISENPAWFVCRWCDYRGVCHGTAIAEHTCRTCAAAVAERDGKWRCDFGRAFGHACDLWLPLPGMTPGEAVDYSDEWEEGTAWIDFRAADGRVYRMGAGGLTHAEASQP
jgi:hypothetical protein